MSANLLDAVKDIFRTKEEKKAADFDALVRVFDDPTKPPKPAWVAEQLEQLGKTADDLRAAVEYRRKRLDLRKKLDDLPRLKTEQAAVEKAYQAEIARWEKLEKEHDAILAPIHSQGQNLHHQITDAQTATGLLRSGYAGPLLAELQRLEAEQASLTRAIRAEEHPRDELKARLAAHPRTQHDSETWTPAEEKAIQNAIDKHDATIAELTEQRRGLEQQQAEVENQMLLP